MRALRPLTRLPLLLVLACNGLVSGEIEDAGGVPSDAGASEVTTDGGADAAIENLADASVRFDGGGTLPTDGGVATRLIYVATGQDMRHLISFDGLTWQHDSYVAATGLDNAFSGAAIGNHAIVISGDPGIYRSTDGIDYTRVVAPTSAYGFHSSQCAFANGQFVIVAGPWAWRSIDGVTWESKKATEGASGHWHSLVYGNGRWLALGDQVRKLSENGLDWHDITTFEKDTFADVAFGNGRFLAVGKVAVDAGTATAAGWVATSTDGVTWSLMETVPTVYNTGFATVTFGDGLFLTKRANHVLSSVDGVGWAIFSPSTSGNLSFASGRFAAAGWRTEASLYQPDAGRFVSTYSGTHPNKYDDAGIEPWFTGFAMGEL